MAWVFEEPVPFAITGRLFFSPIVAEEIYVIDRGTHFWKYNLATHVWTELASPTYNVGTFGNITRNLVPSPDGTRLACISEASDNERGGKRIETYTIATNSWTASAQCPIFNDPGGFPRASVVSAIVWADNDTLWAWAGRQTTGVKVYTKCLKYIPSANTWTVYAAILGGLTYVEPLNAAITAAGTIVFGSLIGVNTLSYCKYTIAADAYATGAIAAGRGWAWATDDDKLWYIHSITGRQGYLDVADESSHDNCFTENTQLDVGYGRNFGLSDDLVSATVHARSSPPELMTEGHFRPLVQTDPATEIT